LTVAMKSFATCTVAWFHPVLKISRRRGGVFFSAVWPKNPRTATRALIFLFKTITRAMKGWGTSADAACSNCGHINVNTNSRTCENGICEADLNSLFRPCYVCAKNVRVDIDMCPGWGADIAAHYLFLDRKRRIDVLKDEDPAEAIGLLEDVLKDNAGKYRDEAVTLVRELRAKQEKLGSLLSNAVQHFSAGKPQQALETWHSILKICPRHREALKQSKKLQSIINKVENLKSRTTRLLDQAQFEEADQLLQQCLELIPNSAEVKKELELGRTRAHKYAAAFKQASDAATRKLLLEADRMLSTALVEASESKDALLLKTELVNTMEKTQVLLESSKAHSVRADFQQAHEDMCCINKMQLDFEAANRFDEELPEHQEAYKNAVGRAQQAKDERDLSKAKLEANKVLKICPESKDAKSLLSLL
jgi:hypothetical protein